MVFRSTRPLLALTLLVVSAALASADTEVEKRFKVLDVSLSNVTASLRAAAASGPSGRVPVNSLAPPSGVGESPDGSSPPRVTTDVVGSPATSQLHARSAKRGIVWVIPDGGDLGYYALAALTGESWMHTTQSLVPEALKALNLQDEIDFVPFVAYDSQITFPRAAKAVLTYDKPNFESTRVSPVDAAKTWPQFEIIAGILNAPLGAPAAAPCANNCTAVDPFAWWDDFFASCENCKVDFIPTSLLSCNVGWMTAYLEEIHARYNCSVWVTEFGCPSRSSEEQYAFMESILDWLERTPWIERYAALGVTSASLPWMSAAGQLFDSTRRTLTELGKLYDAFEQHAKPDVLSCEGLGGLKAQRERAEELGIVGVTPENCGGLQSATEGSTWSELCSLCVAALQEGGTEPTPSPAPAPEAGVASVAGHVGSDLPDTVVKYCSADCGFYLPVPGRSDKQ